MKDRPSQMKANRLPLIMLALGLAGGAGTWCWQRWVSPMEPATPVESKVARAQSTRRAVSPQSAPPQESPARDSNEARVAAPVAGGEIVLNGADGTIPDPKKWPAVVPVLSEQELQRRAARIEQEANHDLKHLVGLLGLDDAQQDRIFDTLVRHSPDWHPAMQPVGVMAPGPGSGSISNPANPREPDNSGLAESTAPGGSGTLLDAIAKDLTPEQLDALANEELDRQEWWESIIAQLLPESGTPQIDIATGTAGGSGSSTTGTSAAAAPPQTGGPVENKSGDDTGILVD